MCQIAIESLLKCEVTASKAAQSIVYRRKKAWKDGSNADVHDRVFEREICGQFSEMFGCTSGEVSL